MVSQSPILVTAIVENLNVAAYLKVTVQKKAKSFKITYFIVIDSQNRLLGNNDALTNEGLISKVQHT